MQKLRIGSYSFRSFYGSSEPGTPPHHDSIPSNPLHFGSCKINPCQVRISLKLNVPAVMPSEPFSLMIRSPSNAIHAVRRLTAPKHPPPREAFQPQRET